MSGAIPQLPNTPSWHWAQLKAQGQLYLYLYTCRGLKCDVIQAHSLRCAHPFNSYIVVVYIMLGGLMCRLFNDTLSTEQVSVDWYHYSEWWTENVVDVISRGLVQNFSLDTAPPTLACSCFGDWLQLHLISSPCDEDDLTEHRIGATFFYPSRQTLNKHPKRVTCFLFIHIIDNN